jgi:hypothetical protein
MRHPLTRRFASSFSKTAQNIERLDDWGIATEEEHRALSRLAEGAALAKIIVYRKRLGAVEFDYLAACQEAERLARWRTRRVLTVSHGRSAMHSSAAVRQRFNAARYSDRNLPDHRGSRIACIGLRHDGFGSRLCKNADDWRPACVRDDAGEDLTEKGRTASAQAACNIFLKYLQVPVTFFFEGKGEKGKCQITATMDGDVIASVDYQGDETLCQRYAARLRP